MRLLLPLVALLLAFVAAACSPDELVCRLDTECVGGHGEFGLCLESRCAFRDVGCNGGYRWDDAAGSMANQCVDPATVNAHRDGGVGAPDAGTHD
jgi:hypothetical protein